MTQKIKIIILAAFVFIGVTSFGQSQIYAACAPGEVCGSGGSSQVSPPTTPPASTEAPAANDACNDNSTTDSLNNCLKHNKLINDINDIVDFLSGLVGVIVTIMLVVGGIQYSLAGDSPEATAKAKKRITNALFALVAFFFIFAFLNWLIPGGIFN